MATTSLLNTSFTLPTRNKKTNKFYKAKPRTCRIKMSLQQQQQQPPKDTDILTTITKLLWGKSLPPQLLITTVRTTWNATWHLMMKQLAPTDPTGSYTRPVSKFRANFKSYTNNNSRQNLGKLHLYVGLPCPWAHRTLIVRALKGLEESIPVSIASPSLDGSWEFRQMNNVQDTVYLPGLDNANGCKNLKQVYRLRRGGYDGRSTVPLLWDVEKNDVACNESYDIIEFFNSLASNESDIDLSPTSLKAQIDKWNQIIYPNVNNGVYRCGFAQSQEAYDTAVNGLFSTLDMIDDHLASSRYLCGDVLTLADVCLFTTLIRFDLVYNVLFKCTKKKLLEYPNIHGYLRDVYQIPKVAETCNFEAIMDGYYKILFPLNPGSIQPAMPSGCDHKFLSEPHNRELLSSVDKHVEAHVS